MKIYWRQKDIPELVALPAAERQPVWMRCCLRYSFLHWQVWVGILGCFAFAILGSQLGLRSGHGFLGTITGVLFGSFLFQQIQIHYLRPHLRDYLQSHGYTAYQSDAANRR